MKETQKIHESTNSIIYKGKYSDFNEEVIIKILNSEFPTEEQITSFYNEYEFTKKVESSFIRKVLRKDKEDGKHILILEYLEGLTLRDFISKNNPDIASRIKIFINIVSAFINIHKHNIIHKDINPSNIIVNKQGEIKIIDFGLASIYNIKTQHLGSPKNIEGTLAYISPEQTGRMNRILDYRTDFYSLGVTFYEILTGKLPFEYKDAMKLVHAHIAELPKAPHLINNKIPKLLSKIVLKLLKKNAEDRYQSAFGLKYDLNEVLNYELGIMNSEFQISNFKLGKKDFSGRLIIPEKLYGREKEIEKLCKIYENVSQGQIELLLISGLPGVGKSALVHELNKLVNEKQSIFIEGKYDQYQKDIPYYAIIQTFAGFVDFILKESEEELNYWRKLIQDSVGDNGQVLINLVPELELVIGKQSKLSYLEGDEALNRFNYVWSNAIKAVSNAKRSVIIFIDDLQWADNASIELLKVLLSESEMKYFFCIIAYRDNEINISDLLAFENIKELNVSNIKLGNLTKEDVNVLVNDCLAINENVLEFQDKKAINMLSDLIFSKTIGNPFFINQFIKSLYEEEFLKFDFNKNIWKWNFTEIQKQNITDNVVELLTNKIRKVPNKTQEILKIAACIGNNFDLKTLAIISNKNEKIAQIDLEIAIFEDLIIPLDKQNFKFAHDRIQQVVYSTIPDIEKNNFHWQAGKLLLKFLDTENIQKQIFDIVNQLNYGKDLINNWEEKKQLVELNLQAATKAKEWSAYSPAYNYMKNSSFLLKKNSWDIEYDITLRIYNELATFSYLTGNYNETKNYVDIIINRTTNTLHKVNAYYSLINVYRAQSLYDKVIQTGLKILSDLDVKFPKKISTLHVLISVVKVYFLLKRQSIKKFKELPLADDERSKAQLKLFDAIASSAYFSDINLFPLLVSKAMKVMIRFGFSRNSPYFISGYGMILGMFNKIENANEIGEISSYIQKTYSFNQIKCRSGFVNLCLINVWKIKLIEIKNNLLKNYKIGLENGDLEYACGSLYVFSYFSLFSNIDLISVEKLSNINLKIIKKLKQNPSFVLLSILLHTTQYLLNENSFTENSPIEKYRNENIDISILIEKNDSGSLSYFYLTTIFLIYIFNNIEDMEYAIEKLLKYQDGFKGHYFYALANFYSSLCTLVVAKNPNLLKNKLKTISKNQKQMKIWTKHCPENFQHKYDLVEAEKYRVLGENDRAKKYYDKAIRGANENNFISEEAISWEAAGRFYLQINNKVLAKVYLQNAYKTYKLWGVVYKLKQITEQYPEFIFENQNTISGSTVSYSSTNFSSKSSSAKSKLNLSSMLDLTSIVKASQSLSGEVKFEKLLKSMLMLIMENAGADYAVIIKNDEDVFTVEAKGKYCSGDIEVLRSENFEKSQAVPLNIVKYVIRTQKLLVIDNAITHKEYSYNDYIQRNKVKSIFCYPVINKNKLVAILYLENNLSNNVFTPKHIETIRILSSQIAVSIENALLYENLEERVKDRTNEVIEKNEKLYYQKEEIQLQAKELKIKNKQLLKLDTFKEEMTRMIIHDLKNPLNSIIGFASNDFVKQSGRQMLLIITNILDIYKYENTKIKIQTEKSLLQDVVISAINQVKILYKRKNIELINNIKVFFVEIDKDIIERVFVNILTNAIKFTPNNGLITLDVVQPIVHRQQFTDNNQQPMANNSDLLLPNEGFIKIEISDTGIGIPEDKLDKVFDKFAQVFAKKSGLARSTGIGLTFCKLFIEAHGCEIGVKSTIGKGTIFWFTLQLSKTSMAITQKNNNIAKDAITKNNVTEIVVLTDDDKKILNPFLELLQKFEMYELSSIKELLEKLDDSKSDNLKAWKKQVVESVINSNEEIFKKLIDRLN